MSAPAFVLDDDPSLQKMIAAILQHFGLSCEAFAAPDALFKRLPRKKPALLFLDLHIQERYDGFLVLQRLRAEYGDAFPVVMISGDDDPGAIAHSLEMGATDYLLKPFSRDVFMARLGRHFDSAELNKVKTGFDRELDLDHSVGISFDIEVLAVDESRVRLRSPHLIAKGTVFELKGDITEKMTGRAEPLLLTVRNTWVEGGRFMIDAEPDLLNAELVGRIRTWISTIRAQ